MITKIDAQKIINLYRPIQLEIQEVIFLMRRAYKGDSLLYVEQSPQTVIDYLEQADKEMYDLLWNIQDMEEQ